MPCAVRFAVRKHLQGVCPGDDGGVLLLGLGPLDMATATAKLFIGKFWEQENGTEFGCYDVLCIMTPK